MKKIVLTFTFALSFILGAAFAQDAPQREITRIAGDLYRFQNNFHFSVLLVTPEGIIATDPINADAAQWLKEQVAEQFGQPIKYVIYSHDHADHISGGEVFKADGAIIVAHDNAKDDIIGEGRATAVPDVTFNDELTIELGGKVVELHYVGRNHSDNSLVMHFPEERTVFIVDFIPTGKALPFMDLPDSYLPDWIESIEAVEAMDFDILAPGHGALGTKEDVTAMKNYMQDLYDAVLEQAQAGKTLEETMAAVKLEQYADWAQYADWLPLNIEGAYTRIQLQRRGISISRLDSRHRCHHLGRRSTFALVKSRIRIGPV